MAGFAVLVRVLVFAAGTAAAQWPTPYQPTPGEQTAHPRDAAHRAAILAGPVPWLEPWYRWDALWYAEVSAAGYRYEPGVQSTTGFLPLLPAIMAAADAAGIDRYVAGWLVPNAAFVIGLACFGRLAFAVTRDQGLAWWACALLVTYPFAFFFGAPYQESLFLALSAGALLAWQWNRPVTTAALTGIAGLARLTSVAIPLGLMIGAANDWWRGRRPRAAVLLVAIGAAVGPVAFFSYLAATTGDPFAHLKSHAAWGRTPPSLTGVVRTVEKLTDPGNLTSAVPQAVIIAGCLALGVRGWVRRGPLWGILILVPVLQAVSTGTPGSIQRIALSSYPAALEAADLPGRRWVRWGWVVVGIPLQLWLLHRYTHNGFVG